MTTPQTLHTCGTITFGLCGPDNQPLFQIRPGIPALAALEHAALLQDCMNHLLLEMADGEAHPLMRWSALHVGEMGKAILDDLLASGVASAP
ncbi:DUF3077 domain-containing protein [Pseudomonas sp. HR96]|uniref:DUF3077 domain-containing protein n=1 Tax=Pseudomonas sp. HR96 TaxID=1027966 RepID=UPI002A758DDC|nr:DUF3077 domain-containing protein [Pseudomonas sp. HR96]WPP00348.1 DUF3077 domain-containing protein [Pseudomonas sp. HR96]